MLEMLPLNAYEIFINKTSTFMHSYYNLQKKEKSRADLTPHVTWKLFLLLLCHCHNNSIHAQFPFCVYVIILNGNFFDDRKKRREAN